MTLAQYQKNLEKEGVPQEHLGMATLAFQLGGKAMTEVEGFNKIPAEVRVKICNAREV